jgi:hypothetical protein
MKKEIPKPINLDEKRKEREEEKRRKIIDRILKEAEKLKW